jgi:pyruvate/2-oxoglutarate/acetoin dehydrogenase E1 component/TPP-dependent pyruvate/acetoin dehydrogenase alpha subunit
MHNSGGGGGAGGIRNPTTALRAGKDVNYKYEMTVPQIRLTLDASMATFSLHVHARIASLVGKGLYTIGPCGEELLSSAALSLQPEDSMALHYRHSGISIARQLNGANSSNSTLEEILLARARGYTVSRNDPVTGGVHCSIGGGENDFIVTSTLASQCPGAVGRALGYALARKQQLKLDNHNNAYSESKSRPVSFCTLGDGSIHNHHFTSSWTLARHAKHLNIKCPLVFGISDNGLSISYQTQNFSGAWFRGDGDDPLMDVYQVDGQDLWHVYSQTKQAVEQARKYQTPVLILYQNMVRRFGHAATDRQSAYLSAQQIQLNQDTDVVSQAMVQAVGAFGHDFSYAQFLDRFQEIHTMTGLAFAQAIEEPKVTLQDMMDRVGPPDPPVPQSTFQGRWISISKPSSNLQEENVDTNNNKPQVMRKQMTRVLEEIMTEDPSVVYLGEDVIHGGYYLVTLGLAEKFPGRVVDFPPDETTLLGCCLGFAQVGLTPIVEIPYAKYLDCGVDMFNEIGILNWLSNGQSKNGMVIRLQGFDRGVFGGNFHTHNMLSHMPPGVDVVCFSNGLDYARGLRHAIHQAKQGRVVVSVDCTNLLNLRHLHDKDRQWEHAYPQEGELLTFDDVRLYSERDPDTNFPKTCVVSYGNGVVTALQARRALVENKILSSENELDIIDCPYLSGVPKGLETLLVEYQGVVFADITKNGPGSNVFSSMITNLQEKELLPNHWSFVGAPRTYNPLGSTLTFLNSDKIEAAVTRLVAKLE